MRRVTELSIVYYHYLLFAKNIIQGVSVTVTTGWRLVVVADGGECDFKYEMFLSLRISKQKPKWLIVI